MTKSEPGFGELLMQARITNRLLAAQLRATVGQQEMVRLLSSTGASHQEIADVLDTTAATVATTLQRLKKKAMKVTVERDPKSREQREATETTSESGVGE